MSEIKQVTFKNGVKCYAFASFDAIIDFASERKGILVAINAEKILHATEQTKSIINRNIGYSDGSGAVMALKKHGCKDAVKIPGCELWLKVIERLQAEGKSFYLVGGKSEVIEETVAKLKEQFEGIRILGYRDGYLKTEDEKKALIDDIAEKKPDAVFVAMGSPKQELLMEEIKERHDAIYIGLGGSFDVYTGRVNRAPKWWLDHNLEFAYRLVRQPSRIKRQIFLLKFLFLLKLGKI